MRTLGIAVVSVAFEGPNQACLLSGAGSREPFKASSGHHHQFAISVVGSPAALWLGQSLT